MDEDTAGDTIVLDPALRGQDEIASALNTIFTDREADVVGDIETFAANILSELETIRSDFQPIIDDIESVTLVNLMNSYDDFETEM